MVRPPTRPTTERPRASRRRGALGGARFPPRRAPDGREGPCSGAEMPDPGGCEGTIPGGSQEPPRVLVDVTQSNDPIRGRARCEAEAGHDPFTSRVVVGPERDRMQGTPKRSRQISRFIRPCLSTVLGGRSPPATATPAKGLEPINNFRWTFHVESREGGTERACFPNKRIRKDVCFRSCEGPF